jgi:hypothetical protein
LCSALAAIKTDKEEKRKIKEEAMKEKKKQSLTPQQKSLASLPSLKKDAAGKSPTQPKPTPAKASLDDLLG